MNKVKVAAIQMRCAASVEENLRKGGSHGAKGGGRGSKCDPCCRNFLSGNIFARQRAV